MDHVEAELPAPGISENTHSCEHVSGHGFGERFFLLWQIPSETEQRVSVDVWESRQASECVESLKRAQDFTNSQVEAL